MQRNLAMSLFEHGRVRTTLPKAKDLRPFAERLITLAKLAGGGSLTARRSIHKIMGDRSLIPAEHRATYEGMSDAKRTQTMVSRSGRRYRTGAPKGRLEFTAESVTHRLIQTIAPKYAERPGGYTRLIRLAERRLGDQSKLAIVQLVGDEESPGSVSKPAKSARKRRTDARYTAAVKAIKSASRGKRENPAAREPGTAGASDDTATEST